MIIGIYLKYIKNYISDDSSNNKPFYIPITQGDNFCGIIGKNGAGKSAILEIIDCFFNEKTPIINNTIPRLEKKGSRPLYVPIFLLDKSEVNIDEKYINNLNDLNEHMWDATKHNQYPDLRQNIIQLNKNNITKENYWLIPIGYQISKEEGKKIFFNINKYDNKNSEGKYLYDEFKKYLLDEVIFKKYTYVYIPKEISTSEFTKIGSEHFQLLLGENLQRKLENAIGNNQIIGKLNNTINEYIDNISKNLSNYLYKKKGDREVNLTKKQLVQLIQEKVLVTRNLYKDNIDINNFSSGEKQKALIDIANNLVRYNKDINKNASKIINKNIILAIDEPESSLHISECYEQFSKLEELSLHCKQILFTTHWYGFIPTISHCSLIHIEEDNDKRKIFKSGHYSPLITIMKSISDLSQTILSSMMKDNPLCWLICEGESDQIYLEKYLATEIRNRNLRVIQLQGKDNVIEAYKLVRILAHYDSNYSKKRGEAIRGKAIFLVDTDAEKLKSLDYDSSDKSPIQLCRYIYPDSSNGTCGLVHYHHDKIEKLDIEDCLDGKLFYKTILSSEFLSSISFSENINIADLYEIKKNIENGNIERGKSSEKIYFYDLTDKQKKLFDNLFMEDGFKTHFARAYTQELEKALEAGTTDSPRWIEELKKKFFN